MKKEVADLWIAALESGEYDQARGTLQQIEESRTGDEIYPKGFCCLGVLCEVAIKNGLNVEKVEKPWLSKVAYDNYTDFLPSTVQSWAGMKTSTGEFDVYDNLERDTEELTDLNDTGKTFKEIAQIIRNNWEKL